MITLLFNGIKETFENTHQTHIWFNLKHTTLKTN